MAVVLWLASSVASAPKVQFSKALGSHMVLQQAPAAANVWGTARGAETVTIKLSSYGRRSEPRDVLKASVTVTVGADCMFGAKLPPQAGGPQPHRITAIADTGGPAATMDDVLFGEVHICGGQ